MKDVATKVNSMATEKKKYLKTGHKVLAKKTLPSLKSTAQEVAVVPTISAVQVQQARNDYLKVDNKFSASAELASPIISGLIVGIVVSVFANKFQKRIMVIYKRNYINTVAFMCNPVH